MLGKRKDLLGLKSLSAEDIRSILTSTETMKYALGQPVKKTPHLTGKSIVEIFQGESIRTKLSFELAAKYLSGTLSTVTIPSSSTRERLLDIATAVDRMGADTIVVLNNMSGSSDLIARNVNASVINAGDGMNEQPTQALVDIFTIYKRFGKFEGLKVAIVGDILHSGVARSNIWGLLRLGAEVCVGGPATLLPPGLERYGVSVFFSAHEAVIDADVIISIHLNESVRGFMYPDTREYAKFFGIDEKCLGFAKPGALILHALPVRRGVEMVSGVIREHETELGSQVTNGIAVKMAVLYLFAKKGGFYEHTDN